MLKIFKSMIYFIFCKFFFRVEYINLNKEKLTKGNNIICANHNDWMDSVVLWTKTDKANIMAKAELFKVPGWSHFIRSCGAFPIHRGENDFKSVFHAIKLLKHNNNLIIFPEGTRKARQKNVKAKIGTVYMAIASGANIIPVYIEEGERKLFGKIRVVYGEQYNLNEYKDRIKDKDVLNDLTEELMNKIYGLGDVLK